MPRNGDVCLVCLRPATTRDSEGDPSCVQCAAMERAHEMDWEIFDSQPLREWDRLHRIRTRKQKFERRVNGNESAA